ncbi:uncharacterized protein LOC123967767 [Micropterus dolomieu]|uniref:uncharacterized protein LOC123967767 n=1 Tax=Micropterus dolomieu TaxID=147949 RepID=UPI001E8E3B8B|nr:uncharacterized protein LOC123967767 [Micropterus dolomieu]
MSSPQKIMEKSKKELIRTKQNISYICLLLLAMLQANISSSAVSAVNTTSTTTTSTQNPAALSYSPRPADVTVTVGTPAVFLCGVPKASPNLTFTFYGSHRNYELICPYGHMKEISQGLYGSCDMTEGESLAVWTLKGTSLSDNGTRVVCQQSNNPDAPAAILYVNALLPNSYAILIGCTIGGFIGTLLLFGLLYTILQRSETIQKCFRGKETEDDLSTIVTND